MNRILFFFILIPYFGFCQWTQVGSNVVGESASDEAGSSSSISANGNIIAVGARANGSGSGGSQSGHTRIYENLGGVWTQIGSDIDGTSSGDGAGASVSLSSDGNRVAIGAPGVDGNGANSGQVKIYDNIGGAWILDTDIIGEAVNDESGGAVSLSGDGNVIAIGARLNDGNGSNSGHIRVYEKVGNSWNQLGSDIDGDNTNYYFGTSVSLNNDGTVVAIGATGADSNGANSGQVKIYENIGGVWIQKGSQIDGEFPGDNSGSSVSINANGDYVVISGTLNDGNGNGSGQVRVFQFLSNNWVQVGGDIDGEAAGDNFGYAVSISADGSVIAASSIFNSGNGNFSGHVRVYKNTSTMGNWMQVGVDIDGHTAIAIFGTSVNLSDDGSTIVIGGNLAPGTIDYSGHVRVYKNPTLSISENIFMQNVEMYPNPTKGGFVIDSNHEIVAVKVFDIHGKLIKTYSDDMSIYYIEELPSGIYFVNIETDRGLTTKKLIKN